MGSTAEVGDVLVAAPGIRDPLWRRTVALLIDNDEAGSMGVIVNRPAELVEPQDAPEWLGRVDRVMFGGPVAESSLLILAPAGQAGSERVAPGVSLVDISGLTGGTPEPVALEGARVFAGYAGWGPDQLLAEITRGDWLVLHGVSDQVLTGEPADLWSRILRASEMPWRLWATLPPDPIAN